ncbi:MAG: heterodisulfide reductase-related iron-sulfur binding cluster [Dehalococcoidia bacterium]
MRIATFRQRRTVVLLVYAAAIVLIPATVAIAVAAGGTNLGGATREVFWNIASWARIFAYAAAALAVAVVAYGPYRRYRLWCLGKAESRFDRWPERLRAFLFYGIGQGRLPNDLYASAMHLLIFWGWVVLFIGTLMLAFHDQIREYLSGTLYLGYSLTLDIFGLAALVGLGMALYRRYLWRPPKLRLGSLWDDEVLLWLMTTILLSGFMVEGMRLGVTELAGAAVDVGDGLVTNPDWAVWSPVGWLIGKAATGAGASETLLRNIHKGLWWAHLPMALTWVAWVGYGKLSHIILGSGNILLRKLSTTGAQLAGAALTPITDFETVERFGGGKLPDFTWKQLADVDVCVRCGRCEANCPAHLTGKELTPMGFLKEIKDRMYEVGPAMLVARQAGNQEPIPDERLIAGDVVSDNVIWDCLTCGACEAQCPIFIEHIQKLQDMRRYLVMDEARMPETAQATLMNLEQRGHPWRGTQLTRTSWMEGMDVPIFDGSQEYLYWVGCTGALVERNVKVTQAIVGLLQQAGVSFGVLGAEETCSGDPARRLGNEYLFQLQAQQNIETFKAKGVRKVLTHCPHCFNVMRNEYPQLDGAFEVSHHSQLLAHLIGQGRLQPDRLSQEEITYHDSCYLGRFNGVYEPPRQVVKAITGQASEEMGRCRVNGFCCGAGGGHMWVEESKGRRVNHVRTEEAAATGAGVITTACPFCMQMFEEGVGSVSEATQREMKVWDIAELLEAAVVPSTLVTTADPKEPEQ